MSLSCFVFSTDQETTGIVRQALADLSITGEFCSEGFAAGEQLSRQVFQLVIMDWDDQPETSSLLTTARQRKASERPLALVIVRDDASVPKALQGGANSILRKPIVASHCKETLSTALDLLKARQAGANGAPRADAKNELRVEQQASANELPAPSPASSFAIEAEKERVFRAGEFLQSAPARPGGQFETEADVLGPSETSAAEPVDPLKDLEPVASSVQEEPAEGSETSPHHEPRDKPRGLDWYLKKRGPNRAQEQSVEAPANPELLTYEFGGPSKLAAASSQVTAMPSEFDMQARGSVSGSAAPEAKAIPDEPQDESNTPRRASGRRVRSAMVATIVLAGGAAVAAPQAPWHGKVQAMWNRGQQTVQAWLNPQVVTPVQQAPVSHENFGRAGDEYKLPVAENIPDATTDPSQIKILPAVDPTKKPSTESGSGDSAAAASGMNPNVTEVPSTASGQPLPLTAAASSDAATGTNSSAAAAGGGPDLSRPTGSPKVSDKPTVVTKPQRNPSVQYVSTPAKVPSSLQTQVTAMTPTIGGDKPVEAAMPSIEPVSVSEAAERALLTDQPTIAYPANGAGQQGTVSVEVLVDRDGTVQDARFLQGPLALAKNAVNGVKQWKFKPYMMNGRPVSVQTVLTIKFTP